MKKLPMNLPEELLPILMDFMNADKATAMNGKIDLTEAALQSHVNKSAHEGWLEYCKSGRVARALSVYWTIKDQGDSEMTMLECMSDPRWEEITE